MPLLPDKKAGEIMIPAKDYLTVPVEGTFKDAADALARSMNTYNEEGAQGHQLVLVTDDGKICGLVSLKELLNAIEPQFLKSGNYRGWNLPGSWAIPVFWEGLFNERCLTAAKKPVKEIMLPLDEEIDVLDVNDTMIKAVYYMTKHGLDAIFVLKDGEVVGLLRNTEVFQEMHNLFTHDRVSHRKTNRQLVKNWGENVLLGKTINR